jgi:transposase
LLNACLAGSLRFVAGKSEAAQANATIFRTRDQLVRQRTQNINALRGHLAEYGLITGQGIGQVSKLIDMIDIPACELPEAARSMLKVLSGLIAVLDE